MTAGTAYPGEKRLKRRRNKEHYGPADFKGLETAGFSGNANINAEYR